VDELESLINQYNEAEEQQQARLKQIYRLLRDTRRNYRAVYFSSASWTNCWKLEDRLGVPTFVEALKQFITKVELGDAV
jgi:hypothetical protein